MGHILVVAPGPELRSSVSFLLESEGHLVSTMATLPSAEALACCYDCIVLDHHCVTSAREAEALRRIGPPVVLLANSDGAAGPWFRIVVKPLLGCHVVDAVERALGRAVECAVATCHGRLDRYHLV